MDTSVQQVDELCGRLGLLADQAPKGFGAREEQAVAEIVHSVQRIGEGIAWAYKQHPKPQLGEHFAQPFVDHRLRDRFKGLLADKKPLRRDSQNRIAVQILQTIHVLLQATPAESMLFCNLTAGWYLNEVISVRLDFTENEDLLPMWMTVVKDIAMMLDRDNMMLFFDPSSDRPFPIFTEAVRYYHHPMVQVRTQAQTTSLEIYLKLRDKNFWAEPLFDLVIEESRTFFTHACCLLREFWRLADENVRAGEKRNARNALYMQNDILMFVNDVFMCEIPQLSAILEEKLLRFAVLPVLVRSVLRPRSSREGKDGESRSEALSGPTAWYLLYDMLTTLRNSPVFSAVAFVLLRPQVPEEVLRLVYTPPPRNPTKYCKAQEEWRSESNRSSSDLRDATSDEVLYSMPPVPLITLLDNKDKARSGVANKLLDAYVDRLMGLSRGEATGLADSLLGTSSLLLRTLQSEETLHSEVAERIGYALCEVVARHRQLQWSILEGALNVLRELHTVANVRPGRSRRILGPPLHERVVAPLASELLSALRQPGESGQDIWLQEFQEQWAAHQASSVEVVPNFMQQQHDFLDPAPVQEPPGTPLGRARCMRVLLVAWQLAHRLDSAAKGGDRPQSKPMPGFSNDDIEELARYQPGVPVHIGKMNRVKCYARSGTRRGAEQEALYLLASQTSLVLVRPDDHKPFWAVPVVVEPLLRVKVTPGGQKAGAFALDSLQPQPMGTDEQQRTLRLEVSLPQSPFLRPSSKVSGPGGHGVPGLLDGSRPGSGGSPAHGVAILDGMAAPPPIGGQGGPFMGMGDPNGPRDKPDSAVPTTLTLVFSDERRRRVACNVLVQARRGISVRVIEGLGQFLGSLQGGIL